jgi:hypothetical protein
MIIAGVLSGRGSILSSLPLVWHSQKGVPVPKSRSLRALYVSLDLKPMEAEPVDEFTLATC